MEQVPSVPATRNFEIKRHYNQAALYGARQCSGIQADVCFWHKADMPVTLRDVAFGGKADIPSTSFDAVRGRDDGDHVIDVKACDQRMRRSP
jgi:hypothetical protein